MANGFIRDSTLPNRTPDELYKKKSKETGVSVEELRFIREYPLSAWEHSVKISKKAPKYDNTSNSDAGITDRDFISYRMIVPNEQLEDVDANNRYYSSSTSKIVSTRLGYHISINPRPQFTRTADIRTANRLTPYEDISKAGVIERMYGPENKIKRTLDIPAPSEQLDDLNGLGRYYSQSVDDGATTVYIQFGVPQFNSLISFFSRAIDYQDSIIANTGSASKMYVVGDVAFTFVRWCLLPYVSLTIVALKFMFGMFLGGYLRYYYLKPAMTSYWGTVNTIVNMMSVELGLLPLELIHSTAKSAGKMGYVYMFNEIDFKILSGYLPGIVKPLIHEKSKTWYIDVFAVATKVQAIAFDVASIEYKRAQENKEKPTDYVGYVKTPNSIEERVAAGKGLLAKINSWVNFKEWFTIQKKFNPNLSNDSGSNPADPNSKFAGAIEKAQAKNGQVNDGTSTSSTSASSDGLNYKEDDQEMNKRAGITKDKQGIPSLLGGMEGLKEIYENYSKAVGDVFGKIVDATSNYTRRVGDTLNSVVRDGGHYAVFNVEYQGSTSDSFSNSYSDIDTANTIRQVGSAARNIKFNVAAGNITSQMDELLAGIKNFAMGALEGVSFGLSNVLTTLLGGGYIDIPQKWDDSSMSLSSTNYKIDLISPYGNIYSQLQNLYIPLAMLMAGALPLATGTASYTSPFLCSVFNRGVQSTKLGMITSLSIERGVTNLPFNFYKRPLSFSVTFTITDFSKIIAAPVNASIFGGTGMSFNFSEEVPFTEYIGQLCGRDFYSNKYNGPKLIRSGTLKAMQYATFFGPAHMGMVIGDVLRALTPLTHIAPQKTLNRNQLGFTQSTQH